MGNFVTPSTKFPTLFNPACGGTFFTVRYIIAKIVKFCDLNRAAVARAVGRARAMASSMAREGDGKHTQDAPARALVGSFDRFTYKETNEGVQDHSESLGGPEAAFATIFGCPWCLRCRETIGHHLHHHIHSPSNNRHHLHHHIHFI